MGKIGYLLYTEEGGTPTFYTECSLSVEEYRYYQGYTIKRIVYFELEDKE